MGYISLTGNPITFTTNRENTISSLVLNGKTNQPGTGDPSPTNIRPIYGVGQYDKKIVIDGINVKITQMNGQTAAQNRFGLYVSDKALGTLNLMSTYLKTGAANEPEYIFVRNTSTFIEVSFLKERCEYSLVAVNSYFAAHPLTVYYQSTSYATATQVYCGFSVTDANGYHGYAAGPMAPLYDGDKLTWSGGSTVEVVRAKQSLVFNGTENWIVNDVAAIPGGHRFDCDNYNYPDAKSNIGLVCSHYKADVGKSNCVWLNPTVGSFGVRIGGLFADLSSFKSYLAAEHAAGTPVTIVYERATPTTETVPISEPITNAEGTVTVSAENTMNVTYFQLEVSNNKYQDIQITDNTLLTQFQQAWSNGDYATAFNIIDNNPQLDTKSFVADVINTLTANLTYLQNLNDPAFKADRIQTSATPPVDLQVGQVYFKTL